MNKTYRTDIDGLRAIAIIPVILFHLGYLSNGYLGVDIFFVISGYLITGLVYNEVEENKFSVLKFYERRVRRIIPLVLFTTSIAFILGLIFMLPDDLENLCQSVFASNFSANNLLMKITSADYWAVKNDYKPLMHTWSLGIEEQFYLLYPVIFFFLKGDKKKFILPLLIILTILSLTAFFSSANISSKFYLLQYRFFELSIGGICAIYFSKRNPFNTSKSHYILYFLLIALVFLLFFNSISSNDIKVLTTTILTAGILVIGGLHFENNSLYRALISNRVFTAIGKISFSLYMWHQIVFAFSRYFLVNEITLNYAIALSIIVVVLSIITYFTIENPFRNRNKIKTKPLLIIVSFSFLIITSASLYVYMVGGIIKNVPELGINKSNRPSQLNFFSKSNNINIQYNEDIRALDKPFSDNKQGIGIKSDKVKVLVLGNSFGRDVANVLLESSFKDTIEVRYSDLASKSDDELKSRISDADFIFFGSNYPNKELIAKYNIDMNKVWIVGTKDFGNSNGIHYNRKIENYSNYRTEMKTGVLEENLKLKKEWDKRYIDLINLVADSEGKVLVFSPDGKFLSQDTVHFTKFGAMFFARLLNSKFKEIMKLT
ncbi:acyltransferase [Riemerella anatipestifer]|nr:acyltransferase [Riemerella anatipestifer]